MPNHRSKQVLLSAPGTSWEMQNSLPELQSGHSRAPPHICPSTSSIIQLPFSVVSMPQRFPACQETQGIRQEPTAAVPWPCCTPKSLFCFLCVSFALPYCRQVPATPGCSQPSPAGTWSTAFAWLQFTAIHTDRICI